MPVLCYGGFPEVALNDARDNAYAILNEYAKTILYRDVAPRLQLRKSVELERLFVYLISNVGKQFSYANLSKLFDITDKVVKEYIGAFADSYLLFELEKFDYSIKKQIRSQKKVYSIDTGQVNAVAFQFTQNLGRLLVNLVFLELKRCGLEVYYYTTRNDFEVDFLAKKSLKLALVQVVWSLHDPETIMREQRALFQGLDELGLKQGVMVTQDHEEIVVHENTTIAMIPAYKFLCYDLEEKMQVLGLH